MRFSHILKQFHEILSDPIAFISRLEIVGKDGRIIKLIPNDEQIRIIRALESGEDIIALKGRQIGSSTIFNAYFFWKIYTSTEPITAAILSHKLASAKHLLEMHKTFYEGLPKILRRPLSVNNTTEMRFADTGAKVIAVSAEGKGGLRSFSCSLLSVSEFAFAPNPEELKATAISSLNGGQLVIETTANYFNDAMHQEIMRAERGEAQWNYLFFPWFDHAEYRAELPEDKEIEWTTEEMELQAKYELDEQQLYWRRLRRGKLGHEKFTREYPACMEDAYSVAGNTYLSEEDFKHIEVIHVEGTKETHIFSKVDDDDKCSIGVDVSAGVGRDYSTITVLSKRTGQPVAMWRSNRVPPVVLAEKIIWLATKYNNAKVLVEGNNYGGVVLNELRHQGYNNIWLRDGKDWITTIKTKTEMFENMKKKIQAGNILLLDNITYSEIRALTVNEKGHIVLPENLTSHADNAVSFALACVCSDSVQLKSSEFLPSWVKSKSARTKRTRAGVAVKSHKRY